MAHDVVLIPGDGIGPEITQAMRRVVEATGVQINWNVQEAGAGVMDEFGTPLPQHVLDAVAETKVAIKGPITTPVGTGFRSVNVALRKHFDLYACVRPCLSQPGDGSRFCDVDLVIVRENTSTPASSSTRVLPRSRSSRSLLSVRAKRPSPPIPRFRSSRSPSPRAVALWSMPLSMPAAAAAKR